jgi:hypothetical protein
VAAVVVAAQHRASFNHPERRPNPAGPLPIVAISATGLAVWVVAPATLHYGRRPAGARPPGVLSAIFLPVPDVVAP